MHPISIIAAIAMVVAVIWGNYELASLMDENERLRSKAESRGDVIELRGRLKKAESDRRIAQERARLDRQLVERLVGREREVERARLQAEDRAGFARAEAAKLKEQLDAIKMRISAAAAPTVEAPVIEAKPVPIKRRVVRSRKPARVVVLSGQSEEPHTWFRWAMPKP